MDLAALIASGMGEEGFRPDAGIVDRLVRLAELLDRWNARMNLTGHRSPEAIARGLIFDALALGARLPEGAVSLVDLGSGAGFPGLPLGIVRPELRVTLVEARERRVHFQRAAVRELQLENIAALAGRAEELEPTPGDLVTAQALAAPGKALELARPWLRPGGLLFIPSSERVAEDALSESGSGQWRVEHYALPLGGPSRALLIHTRAG